MYEELIKRLRNCISDTVEDCTGCPYQGGYKGTYCMNGLISEAADAIVDLQLENTMLREKFKALQLERDVEDANRKQTEMIVANLPRWKNG